MVDLKQILASARTIAVVGCSNRPGRTSYNIARYLQQVGYRVVPINPTIAEALGEQAWPNLAAVPATLRLDVVNVFRRPQYTAGVVAEALERIHQTGEHLTVWTQLGVSSQEAEQLSAEAGLPYVANRCILIEHQRLLG
jgi:hypothetical protein